MTLTSFLATVYLIYDEECVRRSMERMFRAAGLTARSFSSVDDFLGVDCPATQACVVCDIRMPGRSALELPAVLAKEGRSMPVIYVTAHDREETRAAAKQAGAAGYFRKPVDDQALINSINWNMHEARNETDINQPHKIFN